MQIHFIAIGGAAMHNLALALHNKGFKVTGSDDAIFDPSKNRLKKAGLLPKELGWFPDKIHDKLDGVILGMHAKDDNPELIKAKKSGIRIYSYPEYLFEQSTYKTRVVISGSHGKTTITSMVLNTLQDYNIDCDYMVGAQLEGFDTMVKLSDAPIIVLEGDEYLSSPIDKRPKFHLYKPQIALLSGVAWDHINVFPTFENYLKQFEIFINKIEQGGYLTYCSEDESVNIISNSNPSIETEGYSLPDYFIRDNKTFILHNGEEVELKVFGEHNLLNMMGAMNICKQLGIDNNQFLKSMQKFNGAAKRLEKIYEQEGLIVYKDFAHSPSKVKATVSAMKEQYKNRKVIAILELHTFSSLNKNFIYEYDSCMNGVDKAFVFYSSNALKHKNITDLNEDFVYHAFNRKDIEVFTDVGLCLSRIEAEIGSDTVLLFMSSGNFDGVDILDFAKSLYLVN